MTVNVITQTKTNLATELIADGINTETYIPPRITPPLAIISPDNTYVAQGDTFATFRISLLITLVAQNASNEKATEALDELIVSAIGAIPAQWAIDNVEQPFALSANNAEYIATRMAVSTQITI
jgi:hypothetical protein